MPTKEKKTLMDICGCVWEITGGVFVCVKSCQYHGKPKPKRPYRAKAESVRP